MTYLPSVDRGLVGPARQFGIGQIYNPLMWCMLLGALAPIPFWYLGRRYPNSWSKHVHIPVVLVGLVYMPPATGINYSSWFLVGFIFRAFPSYISRRIIPPQTTLFVLDRVLHASVP